MSKYILSINWQLAIGSMLYSVSNIDHVMFACVRNCEDTNESLTELGFVVKVLPLHRPVQLI